MKIHIDELKHRPKIVACHETINDKQIIKPVVGNLKLTLKDWGVHISGNVKTLLKLKCGKCLNNYFQSLSVDIDEQIVYPKQTLPKKRELTEYDFTEELPPDGWLDISDIVYQAVTLAMPVYAFCGCPGSPVYSNYPK